MLIPGADFSQDRIGYTREPWIRIGTHSKRVFFVRACSHGPALPESSESEEVFEAWDKWARAEAERRAAEFQFSPRRRMLYFYLLGMATVNDVMRVPDEPAAVKSSAQGGQLKAMVDLEDRRRVVPVGQAASMAIEAPAAVARQIKYPIS